MSEAEPKVWQLPSGAPAGAWWRTGRVGTGPAWWRRVQALAEQPGMTLAVLGLLMLMLAVLLHGLATLHLAAPVEDTGFVALRYYYRRPWYADLALFLLRIPIWLSLAPVRLGLVVLAVGLMAGGLLWAWRASSHALARPHGAAGTGTCWPVISTMLVFCFLPLVALMIYRPVMRIIFDTLGV